jgi:hypothetical protein
MMTAELTSAQTDERTPTPASAVESAGWLLRSAAIAAVAAGICAIILLPGLRGNAGEQVIGWADRATATLANFLSLLLAALVVWATVELMRLKGNVSVVTRIVLMGTSGLVTLMAMLALLAFRERLTPYQVIILMATPACVAAMFAAYDSALRPHTRAAAVLLLLVAFAALARLGAWVLAARATDHGDLFLFRVSRGVATAGVVFEALGQLLVVTWLGIKSRLAGQIGSTLALAGALLLTWGVARGATVRGAATWEYILHTALVDAPGLPPPYWVDAVATFLVPASLLLGLVAALQSRHVSTVAAPVALVLVSHGSFDAPLRALCAVAGAMWIALASGDDLTMWHSLLGDAEVRGADPPLVSSGVDEEVVGDDQANDEDGVPPEGA